jgi:hypothetical protein
MKAEKQMIAGVYGRLLDRFGKRMESREAAGSARAVTNALFHIADGEPSAADLPKGREDLVDREIERLKEDRDIRRAVTDTLVLKAVFLHRQRGCRDNAYIDPIEDLKTMGIYLEGACAPTPMNFIHAAREFFLATPGQAIRPGKIEQSRLYDPD